MGTMIVERRVPVDDGWVHAEGPETASALMVHGLGYASWEATELRPALSADVQLWSVDNRGSGRSPASGAVQTIGSMAADVAAVIADLGSPLDVIGHSMGGYIAQQLALTCPDHVRRLVLIGTSAGGPTSHPVPESTLRLWAESSSLSPQDYARQTMPASFAPGWSVDHPADFERLLEARLTHPTNGAAWRAQFTACEEFLRSGVPSARIAVPTLVIHGAHDRVVPVENGRMLARSIPDSDYREYGDGGHLVHLERLDEVGVLISDFLSSESTDH